MTNNAAAEVKALAERIKAQNAGHNTEIDHLAEQIIRIVSTPPKQPGRIKFTKLIPPGASG